MIRVFLIAAGGYSKQIVDILKMKQINISGIFDDNKPLNSKYYYDYKIIDNIHNIRKYIGKNDVLFCGIGDNTIRKEIVDNLSMYNFINIISPLANISTTTKIIGTGNYIGHYVNLTSDSSIGSFNIINDTSCIMHDVTIGNFNHLCPMSVVGGNVKIGNNNLIGTNAAINPKITIGDNNIIGSGSVIIKDIYSSCTVVGNPGKIIKTT